MLRAILSAPLAAHKQAKTHAHGTQPEPEIVRRIQDTSPAFATQNIAQSALRLALREAFELLADVPLADSERLVLRLQVGPGQRQPMVTQCL